MRVASRENDVSRLVRAVGGGSARRSVHDPARIDV
jgi:mevalonate pyrophosphate decarboxylase